MARPITITTPRLTLRQWQAADRPMFAAMNADPKVMEFFPSLLSQEQSNALVDRIEGDIEKRGWGLWAAEELSSGRFIGFVGLDEPRAQLPFSPCVEIGWRLDHSAWGKGYASEAAIAALATGFNEIGLSEIVSFTVIGNFRSEAVMKKIGMTKSSETFNHPGIPEGHPMQEHLLYRMTKTEFEQI